MSIFRDIPSVEPIHFFEMKAKFAFSDFEEVAKPYKSPFLLPSSSELIYEDSFAEVAACWSSIGLGFFAKVKGSFTDVSFPNYRKGDSFEIFIDTRDNKTASFTKFCHHFVFFPKEVEEYYGIEITKGRIDDMHQNCDPSLLDVNILFNRNSYEYNIFLPKQVLTGFDSSLSKLGFSYRINRKGEAAQNFTTSSDLSLEKNPNLWASVDLIKGT